MSATAALRWLTALCLLAAAPLPAVPAAAHTELTGSRPSAGALVPPETSEVVLSFSGPVRAELSMVSLTGPGDARVAQSRPAVRGPDVVQAIDRPLTPGTWTLAYRVVAGDGHPITGTVPFTVTAPAAVLRSPTTGTSALPSPTTAAAAPSPPAGPSADAARQVAVTPARGRDEASYGGPLAASAAVLVLGAGAVLALRRRGADRA